MTCDLQATTSIRTGDMRFVYYREGNGGQTPLPVPVSGSKPEEYPDRGSEP